MPSLADMLFISTYTPTYAGEDATLQQNGGLYLYQFNFAEGTLKAVNRQDIGPNPSYILLTADRRLMFVVNEMETFEGQPGGAVRAYRVDQQTGSMTLLNIQPTHGGAPCYIGLDKTEKILMVANYLGGNVATYAIGPDGRLGTPAMTTHVGQPLGPDSARQEHPHAHCATFGPNNRFAFVVDLGIDRVKIYDIDFESSQLLPHQPPEVATAPGAGPRHLIFHDNHKLAYVINELDSTINMYHYDGTTGALQQKQTISTLPPGYQLENTAGHILVAPSGRFLYASNRGHDSIAIFALDPLSGTLTYIKTVSTEGKTPRFFTIDPTARWLLVGNQDSDTVFIFNVDSTTGDLTRIGEPIAVPKPSCIVFARH